MYLSPFPDDQFGAGGPVATPRPTAVGDSLFGPNAPQAQYGATTRTTGSVNPEMSGDDVEA